MEYFQLLLLLQGLQTFRMCTRECLVLLQPGDVPIQSISYHLPFLIPQVLERDLLAPVDLILTPSACLVIITEQNLLSFCTDQHAAIQATSKPAAVTTAATTSGAAAPSPALPEGPLLLQCVAGIAETTLKAISFSFDACVMVSGLPGSLRLGMQM